MKFKKHSEIEGQHAFLSGSKHHWIGYSPEKLASAYVKYLAVQKGVLLHEFACNCIKMKEKLLESERSLNRYVNDAIAFHMTPEQPLYYSQNAFGTADAISFRDNFLRIHDLKTGISPVSIQQLEVYAALFCLEYEYDPCFIEIELRIYQAEEILIHVPNPNEIADIMGKIVEFDKMIENFKLEEESWMTMS